PRPAISSTRICRAKRRNYPRSVGIFLGALPPPRSRTHDAPRNRTLRPTGVSRSDRFGIHAPGTHRILFVVGRQSSGRSISQLGIFLSPFGYGTECSLAAARFTTGWLLPFLRHDRATEKPKHTS